MLVSHTFLLKLLQLNSSIKKGGRKKCGKKNLIKDAHVSFLHGQILFKFISAHTSNCNSCVDLLACVLRLMHKATHS